MTNGVNSSRATERLEIVDASARKTTSFPDVGELDVVVAKAGEIRDVA